MDKKIIIKTNITLLIFSIITAIIAFIYHGVTGAFIIGITLGFITALIANTILYLSGKLPLDYRMFAMPLFALRLIIIFGTIIICMFIKQIDSVAVILPHIYSVPILAVFALLHKN